MTVLITLWGCGSQPPLLVSLSGISASSASRLFSPSTHIVNNMSHLDQALDIIPLSVTVDDRAVKEAVIDQVAKELCMILRVSSSSFTVSEKNVKQALASALIVTQQKVIANPPTFVKIAKKYQRRSTTPALSNASSMSHDPSEIVNGDNVGTRRAGSPEISSTNVSGPGSSLSAGSLGIASLLRSSGLLNCGGLRSCQKLSWLAS